MKGRKCLRKAIREARKLSAWDYSDEALAVLVIRVVAGKWKTGENLVDSKVADELSKEIHKRLNWFEQTGEIRHVIDGARYYFGMLAILLEAGWDKVLPVGYKRFLDTGYVHKEWLKRTLWKNEG
jgi:hypothetical protein